MRLLRLREARSHWALLVYDVKNYGPSHWGCSISTCDPYCRQMMYSSSTAMLVIDANVDAAGKYIAIAVLLMM